MAKILSEQEVIVSGRTYFFSVAGPKYLATSSDSWVLHDTFSGHLVEYGRQTAYLLMDKHWSLRFLERKHIRQVCRISHGPSRQSLTDVRLNSLETNNIGDHLSLIPLQFLAKLQLNCLLASVRAPLWGTIKYVLTFKKNKGAERPPQSRTSPY